MEVKNNWNEYEIFMADGWNGSKIHFKSWKKLWKILDWIFFENHVVKNLWISLKLRFIIDSSPLDINLLLSAKHVNSASNNQ